VGHCSGHIHLWVCKFADRLTQESLVATDLHADTITNWGLLGGGYGILWIVCAGAVVCGWRRFRNDAVLWFLTLTVLGGFAFYVAIYTLRPFYSVERYLLHLAPIMVLGPSCAAPAPTQPGRNHPVGRYRVSRPYTKR
jgi:hypothetical protein